MPVVYSSKGLLLFSHRLYNEVYEAFKLNHIEALIFICETANEREIQGGEGVSDWAEKSKI
jgi:hypothetical protein